MTASRRWRGPAWKGWRGSCYRWNARSAAPSSASTPGIGRVRSAGGSRPPPASGRSRRARWRLRSPIRHIFRSGRGMAAWIGLVPRQTSTGGKERMGRISKQGDQYLRWLLVAGAMTRHPPCQAARYDGPVAGEPHRRQADQGGGRGAGQQERPYRLGATATWWDLSQACDGHRLGRRKRRGHAFGGVNVT